MAPLTTYKKLKNKSMKISKLIGNNDQCERLESIGFTPGSEISLISFMPFKGPLALKIRGTKYALRHDDAACIQVTPA